MNDALELVACVLLGTFYATSFLAVWALVEGTYAVVEWLKRRK